MAKVPPNKRTLCPSPAPTKARPTSLRRDADGLVFSKTEDRIDVRVHGRRATTLFIGATTLVAILWLVLRHLQ